MSACPRGTERCDGGHSLYAGCSFEGMPAICAACDKPCDRNALVGNKAFHGQCFDAQLRAGRDATFWRAFIGGAAAPALRAAMAAPERVAVIVEQGVVVRIETPSCEVGRLRGDGS